jgi:predicted DNA binding CopG/RHH family protein
METMETERRVNSRWRESSFEAGKKKASEKSSPAKIYIPALCFKKNLEQKMNGECTIRNQGWRTLEKRGD